MKRLPTDLQILNSIYEQYYDVFKNYSRGDNTRASKIHVPIDIPKIAKALKVDEDIVFGRHYYHLEKKYGYKQDDGTSVHFFALRIGNDIHSVNFPLLASTLASLRNEARRHRISTWIAVFSLIISIVSISISIISL